mgnify:CR=1 FL=1
MAKGVALKQGQAEENLEYSALVTSQMEFWPNLLRFVGNNRAREGNDLGIVPRVGPSIEKKE